MATLGPITPLPPEEITSSLEKFTVVDNATNDILSRGLTFPSLTGNFRGEMPPNITHLDDGALGNLLSCMAEYCGYAETVLADASVRKEVAKEKLDQIRARLRLDLGSGRGLWKNAQDKNDVVECDPRTVTAKAEFLSWTTFHSLTKVLVDRIQRNWDTISRRITQRGQEVDRMVRGNTMAGVPSQRLTFKR